MQHLPLPDRDVSWQQMKAKLDLEMPLAENRTLDGNSRWSLMGSLLIILLAGIWGLKYTTTNRTSRNSTIIQANDNPETRTVTATNTGDKITYSIDVHHERTTGQKINSNDVPANYSEQNINLRSMSNEKEYGKSRTEQPINLTRSNSAYPWDKSKGKRNIEKKMNQLLTKQHKATYFTAETDMKNPEKTGANLLISAYPITTTVSTTVSGSNLSHHEQNLPGINKTGFERPALNTIEIENLDYSARKKILFTAHSTHLTLPAYVSALPDVNTQRKSALREIKRKERKEERELSRSYKNYQSFWGESTDRWFATGVAPYQNVGIASQEPYHYNSAAGESIISDYIPAPYLQFHFTNRVYLLGEFQFNAPQATPSLLLSQKTITIPMNGTGFTENTYLRKLYYFNLPVSFYYSPVRNFYVGSGLQFSSFNSGLANIELTTSNSNTVLNSTTIKIKDDSLSANIKSSEWRYLFDANYYYDRFMFGFRYNQALNNFIDLNVNNNLPPTQARNQAFQFYIRYNLVVGSRKN